MTLVTIDLVIRPVKAVTFVTMHLVAGISDVYDNCDNTCRR